MKLSDYLVSFLGEKGITDVFGYPGGMVTHLMDSFDKYADKISAHVNYHEQASSFCACGYAQVSHLPGVAYATSGPGATNLVTGIANAYFDSIPCLFITGQVNTYEAKGDLLARQRGFQETDIVNIVKPITKYSVQIVDANDIRYQLEKAFFICKNGRPGPVLLDIPMNILRADIQPELLNSYEYSDMSTVNYYNKIRDSLLSNLQQAKRPLIIAGAGVRTANIVPEFQKLIDKMKIPVVTTMIGVDCLPAHSPYKFGFIGAYGHRYANFIIAKSDCIISIGSRMDSRQTGVNKTIFAQNSKFIRIDIDEGEITNKVKENEIDLICDIRKLLPILVEDNKFSFDNRYQNWLGQCNKLRKCLQGMDFQITNEIINMISSYVPEDAIITTDVGQNQVWVAQSFELKGNQKILFSGGHGAMGYSLPAAIGAYYACHKPIICFVGDGGFQMNIQELQFIVRERLPIKIVLLNNYSLGMIRHFQEMYFDSNFAQTTAEKGYTVPDFCKIVKAYGIESYCINNSNDYASLSKIFSNSLPAFVNVNCGKQTYVYPKLAMNKPIHDQEPLMDRELFSKLMSDEE